MQIRSFRGSGQPAWVNAPLSASFRLGSDPRRALGPAATPAAPTGRTRDRTRPMLHHVKILLPGRRPHVTLKLRPMPVAASSLIASDQHPSAENPASRFIANAGWPDL